MVQIRNGCLPPELSLGVLSGQEARITLGGYTWGIFYAIPVLDSVICPNCGRGDRALRNQGPQEDTQMFSYAMRHAVAGGRIATRGAEAMVTFVFRRARYSVT
jgi:hypothetical protein